MICINATRPIRPRYINVTHRQTDRHTDGRLMTAVSRFAVCTSRSKNATAPRQSRSVACVLLPKISSLFRTYNLLTAPTSYAKKTSQTGLIQIYHVTEMRVRMRGAVIYKRKRGLGVYFVSVLVAVGGCRCSRRCL